MTLAAVLEPWLAGPRAAELLFPLLAVPVLAALLAPLLGARGARLLALGSLLLGLALALAAAAALLAAGAPLTYALGGWAAPLGVELALDGPAALMLVLTAAVLVLVGLHAAGEFRVGAAGRRVTLAFWTLLLGVWAGLNGLYLGRDLFNLYVAIEVLTFSAVPLVCLKGGAAQLEAAFRYLLFALLGSALYLLGAGLMLGLHGTLDIGQIAAALAGGGADGSATGAVRSGSLAAVVLMSTGLLAKTALMPLHLWLPPAHGGAPAPASAVLSALVVKGSFFLLFRLWLDLVPDPGALHIGLVLGTLGAFAILLGNLMALMQARLKLLVAYSTLAQLGYLFLLFPLAAGPGGGPAATAALLQVVSHALAKAALFLLAGRVQVAFGHDRLAELGGFGRALPMTLVVIVLAGLALAGLPPSGGYLVKSLYGSAAGAEGWGWRLVLDLGGLLSAAYLARILAVAVRPAAGGTAAPHLAERPGGFGLLVPGLLALAALLLGLLPPGWFALLDVGRAEMASAAAVAGAMRGALAAGGFWSSTGPVLTVALAVVLFIAAGQSAWQRRVGALGRGLAGVEGRLREWRVAGALLLAILLAQALAVLT
ncbi:complex I subunit 5 family protein [Thiohalocapsa sp. ML1]|uniref:complex I subunit 5 family protein n=1 Tax=Thiohalocapsa sp. ML1 TaxID=1431688 RepID=UPI0007323114|nr:proton-conducting transporter membrane subunit [Thiohalocapsa sp. ML1]